MLDVDITAQTGILFVRLFGDLNKKTYFKFEKEVNTLIKKVGIRNIVINTNGLNNIDSYGIKTLEKCFKLCSGHIFICGNKFKHLKHIKADFINDESLASNLITY